MPVSVQISLVPLPLKSMCVVSPWEDIDGWAWSSAGALAPACREGRGASLAHRGVSQAPPARCGPQCFVSVIRERGAWSHEFIFVHAFLIKRKSECLWFNSFGASIDFFSFSGACHDGSVPTLEFGWGHGQMDSPHLDVL